MANNKNAITITVAVLAILIIGILLLYHPTSQPKQNTSSSISTVQTTYVSSIVARSTSVYTTIPTNASSGGGGTGQSYMSQSQATSLFGPGTYNATGEVRGANLSNFINTYSPYDSGLLLGNVSAGWALQYNTNSTANSSGISAYQITYQSQNSKFLYNAFLNETGFYGNQTNSSIYSEIFVNSSIGGATYSYLTVSYTNTTILVGYKGNQFGYIAVFGRIVNATTIAPIFAQDLSG